MRGMVKRLFGVSVLWAAVVAGQGQIVQQQIGAPFIYPMPQPLEVGPVLDVIPYVLSDGYTINLTLIPSLVEFVGYDEPKNVRVGLGQVPQNAIVVPTVLPRFRVRQTVTTVNVWDGQTVVLGGMLYEKGERIKNKVPLLGDLPLFGRFFRMESRSTQKKNLVVFVTPTIIDPAGNRVHSEDEMPFARVSIPAQPAQPLSQGQGAGTQPAPASEPLPVSAAPVTGTR
ncbi:MAG: type II and III secretion system protein [Verrucomicrobiae bacterium]|nr:type II and III secretion system protein [Verrucomicrobiae bacterium]MDW7980058.1 hypothetical protein [Verrucomicrobiales bacterium]